MATTFASTDAGLCAAKSEMRVRDGFLIEPENLVVRHARVRRSCVLHEVKK